MADVSTVRLADVAELSGGFAFKSEQYRPSGHFVLRTINIREDCSISRDGSAFIAESKAQEFSRFALREHDTLFVMVGATLGKVGYIRSRDLPALLNQNMWVIRALPAKIDPIFLHYCFRELSKIPLAWVSGSARGFLRRDDVRSLTFSLPPIAEQRALGELLKALDDKIELNRRMNETLEAMARAIFKDWFVDFGPTRAKMEGRAPYLAPDIWSLFPDRLDADGKPVGWTAESVYDQAIWVNGAAYKDMHFSSEPDALPVVKIAELKNGITKTTRFTNTDLGQRYKIVDGELLFSWSGNPDTSIDTFVWTSGTGWLNQHIFAVRPNGKRSQAFLYAMLKFLRSDFAEIARNKQTTGLGHVTQQDLIRLRITAPSEGAQAAFDDVVGPLHSRFISNLFENRSLIAARDFLIPKLMSGEIRVREAEKAVEAAQ
jgi:type I restriction enzyme S subunit